jgi:hypothetical protein
MKVAAARIALLLAAFGLPVRAEEETTLPSTLRGKMPEPLLTESITDLDGTRAGEVEIDVSASALHRETGAGQWQSSVEVEWRALERLGFALDLGVGRAFDSARSTVVSVRPAASWVLMHAQPLDCHLMAELSGRVSRDDNEDLQDPGEGALPVSGGLRFGIRTGWLTARTFLGAGAGSHSAHAVPLRAQAAVLAELGPKGRLGFAGFEVDADWARRTPVTLAANLILRGGTVHVPLDLGIAVPWTPQSRYGDASVGVLVRLILEIDRD